MFSFDKKYLYIVLGAFVVYGLISMVSDSEAILSLLLTLPGVLVAITFHEFAHAFAADRLGDDTPRRQGRLSLNPLAHLDPVGTVLLIFAHFGWGKPVQINPRNFNRDVSMQKGEAIVSLAGPVMNFILAVIIAFILGAITYFDPFFSVSEIGSVICTILYSALIVNIGLGVFNLIPLPPLDGSKIFMNVMPYKIRYWLIENEQILYFAFLGIWITGLAGTIISPVIELIYTGIINLVGLVFSIF